MPQSSSQDVEEVVKVNPHESRSQRIKDQTADTPVPQRMEDIMGSDTTGTSAASFAEAEAEETAFDDDALPSAALAEAHETNKQLLLELEQRCPSSRKIIPVRLQSRGAHARNTFFSPNMWKQSDTCVVCASDVEQSVVLGCDSTTRCQFTSCVVLSEYSETESRSSFLGSLRQVFCA